MSFELDICTDKQYWDNFVSTSPQGNIFCLTPFLDALGIDYRLWLIRKNRDVHLGAVMLRDKEGQFVHSPDLLCMYQGLLFSQTYTESQSHSRVVNALKVADFLLSELEKSYSRILFSLHPRFEDLRSFLWFHYHEPKLGQFKVELKYTGLLDLKAYMDFESYISTIRTTRRYEYRKAINDGLTIEVSHDIDKLDYLHHLTFERQGIRRGENADRVLKNIASAALSEGFGELLLCRNVNGEAISAALYLYDKKCGYYMVGANHPDYRNTGSGTLLMVENIRRCQERRLRWVDVCGINSPNRGDFKTSFNTAPVPYFEVIWEKPSLLL